MNVIAKFNNLIYIASHFRKILTGDNRRKKDLILLFVRNSIGNSQFATKYKNFRKKNYLFLYTELFHKIVRTKA